MNQRNVFPDVQKVLSFKTNMVNTVQHYLRHVKMKDTDWKENLCLS